MAGTIFESGAPTAAASCSHAVFSAIAGLSLSVKLEVDGRQAAAAWPTSPLSASVTSLAPTNATLRRSYAARARSGSQAQWDSLRSARRVGDRPARNLAARPDGRAPDCPIARLPYTCIRASCNPAPCFAAVERTVKIEECIFYQLSKANQAAARFLSERLAPSNVTAVQGVVLNFLSEQDAITSKQLGQRTKLDSATLTGILDRLEATGARRTPTQPRRPARDIDLSDQEGEEGRE